MRKVLLLFIGILLLGGTWGVPWAHSQVNPILLPVINNSNTVLWNRYDGTDQEIYLHPGYGAALNLTDNATEDFHPQINDLGQWVRVGNEEGTPEIYLHNRFGEAVNISQSLEFIEAYPQINNRSVVVWQGAASDNEIFLKLPYVAAATQLTDNSYEDISPQISDLNWVVWQGEVDDWEIFLYKGRGEPIQLTNNDVDDVAPQISRWGRVTWVGEDEFGGDTEIFLWKGRGTPLQLTYNDYEDTNPRINDLGRVVWQSFDGNDWEIYLYKGWGDPIQLTDNDYDDINPQINIRGQVAWQTAGSDSEIMLYSFRGVTQVTDNAYEDVNPVINDRGYIAWVAEPGSGTQILLARTSILGKVSTTRVLDEWED